ncbi:lipoprotein [Bordetella ansorpii]|uniref:Lipoprotein n=1 Tax=Bordetella ansorpii TaxID=288768 RepID=A0A157PA15_9BORD|nr:M23 family metallopeptidase [Bordetella ansorpii]SAI30328.1 lipoprotein [Bordetella ansorpii]
MLALALLAACATTKVGPGQYRVQDGDTLTKIARDNGQSVSDLVRWNGLPNADRISEGQVLRVRPPGDDAPAADAAPASPPGSSKPRARASIPDSPATPVHGISLIWPAEGAMVSGYNGVSSKGITIANKTGTPVKAAAAGKVEYASNGLRGYGNLVIVRHGGGFLSIYAHNHKLLVKQGQAVKQGQTIAEMGNSDASRVAVYFELRRNGKPVNPLGALPKR